MKTGILLLNFGGPISLKDVRSFLYRIFSDPNVIGLQTPWRQILASCISFLRARSSIAMYKSIGGSSPLLYWSLIQKTCLQKMFNETLIRIELGMRYCRPTISDGLEILRKWGALRLILFPMFPHYSKVTTGSCLAEVNSKLSKMKWPVSIRVIESWGSDKMYINLMLEYIRCAINKFAHVKKEKPHILFVAHSVPAKIVKQGDPYVSQVEKTVLNLTSDLSQPWSLAYQSCVGPIKWVGPSINQEIKRLKDRGIKSLIIVPISFVCDHIETLYELDQECGMLAKKVGITEYARIEAFNGDEKFINVVKQLLEEPINNWHSN